MKKTIEQKYTALSEIDHILHRPTMYIGSNKEEESQEFIYNQNSEKMELIDINYCPAILKLIDEIISNSSDEFRRKDNLGLNELNVLINKNEGYVIVQDNGGIPVVKHKEAKMYVPEFIFGQLRTSSNYDDNDDRNIVGTNGLGSVLTVIFSKKFEVETSDKKNSIKIEWTNNMSNKKIIEIKPNKKHFTSTKFYIDFDKFEQSESGFSDDFISIIEKRCIDAAASNLGLKVKFEYIDNNYISEWQFKKFEEYMELYSDYFEKETVITYKDNKKQFWICPDSSIDVAFVNGAECSKGTHIKAIRYPVGHAISEVLLKKHKIDVTNKAIDSKYGIFAILDISNPIYSSQTKKELSVPEENFYKDGGKFEIKDDFLKKCQKSEIVDLVVDWYKQKSAAEDEKALRKINRETSKGLNRPDKYITCSSRKKSERQLWIFEGDSAKSGFRGGRNPEIQAGYTMRGVPPNVYGMTPLQIMKNEVFNDLVTILGLKWGKEFNIDDLNFNKIVISTDADVDGDKIASLLLLFFNNWPELFEKNIVCRSISPIIISRKGKDCKKFYTMDEFKEAEKKLKGYSHKYAKGLGGLSNQESKEMYQEPKFLYFKKDEAADSMFRKWFAKGDSETRKKMLNS